MSRNVRISVDAMGGDHGPTVVIPGAAMLRERYPDSSFVFFGDRAQIEPVLSRHAELKAVSEVAHTDVAVAMDAKPSQALRQGRRTSSMWLALEAVRDGRCDFAVSAGNTGALMAMSKFCLKMMPGIERPAIAAIWPTLRGESIVLDVGATIGATPAQLVDFAVMGGAMARALFGLERPTVGLLNVGVEEVKGLEYVRVAGKILREGDFPLDYHGFVEGDDIGKGTVDVVVTEGFSGNIALKTAEGTARQVSTYLRAALKRSLLSRLGFLLASGALKTVSEKMNPNRANGGVFLGLDGIVIKSHGGADAEGVAAAISVGRDMAINELQAKIAAGIELARAMDGSVADDMAGAAVAT
ncbi:phosphate acyltransferase PlsX [Lutibaculum baratangense]|uniref:Phosphate acyltransferase n=1 Tax=Lutibaculum baratangense AMV1 TaxID=631454 RepID=V4T9V3_9HYPH|nr:phosphate acyltransferase PlsX [Lutibaculum baratangense]ESR23278.1 Phosphate:acyl-ACP acyltransferase PlsX [Lutibaculum baratangense AMV1]